MRKTYVQHPVTGKFILKEHLAPRETVAVHGDIEAFVSPIDQSVIDDRKKLREHNHRHGVTDKRDYSDEFILKRSNARHARMTGQDKQGKAERIETIKRAIEQCKGKYV